MGGERRRGQGDLGARHVCAQLIACASSVIPTAGKISG